MDITNVEAIQEIQAIEDIKLVRRQSQEQMEVAPTKAATLALKLSRVLKKPTLLKRKQTEYESREMERDLDDQIADIFNKPSVIKRPELVTSASQSKVERREEALKRVRSKMLEYQQTQIGLQTLELSKDLRHFGHYLNKEKQEIEKKMQD